MFKYEKSQYQLMNFEQLKDTDFFKFFHIHEVETKPGPNGTTIKIMKPGGFKEFIDIDFTLLNDSTLTDACLKIDKNWIGDKSHINPFANDIVKSFISLFAEAYANQDIQLLSDYISRLKGFDDRVIYVQGYEPKITKLPDHLKGAVQVYLGNKDKWEMNSINIKVEMFSLSETKSRIGIRIRYSE